MSRPPHYAYYIPAEHLEADALREILHGLGLDRVWVRLVPTEARFEELALLQLELYDLTEGVPLFVEEIGPALAHAAGLALIVGLDEEDGEAALLIETAEEEIFRYAGPFDDFEATDDQENVLSGEEGFYAVFEGLVGHPFTDFVDADAINVTAADVADGNTDLLLRGRYMGLPKGLPRIPEIFSFHEDDFDVEETDDTHKREEDRVALVLIDLRLTEFLWRKSAAQEVSHFFAVIEPHKAEILGPLAAGLDEAKNWIAQQPPTRPLGLASHPDLVTYEVLAMASTLGYASGMSVHRFDERLLPLLSLGDTDITTALLESSLNDITNLGVLAAMAEILPYSVPEGELLECFADDELAPLAAWAVKDDHYEGALLRLDVTRLIEQLTTFDVEALRVRADRFLRAWFEVAPQGISSFERWRARRDVDAVEWERFGTQLNELRVVLSLLHSNALEPALVFYGE